MISKPFLLLVLICGPSSAPTLAASFDCTKAKTRSEIIICTDPEISALDEELMTLYKKAKSVVADKEAFNRVNRAEWKWRETACVDKECLTKWFYRRKEQLSEVIRNSLKTESIPPQYAPQEYHQTASSQDWQSVQPISKISVQDEFETTRTSRLKAYNSAINEIQKSAIFNQANVAMLEIMGKTNAIIDEWAGTMASLTTTHGGSHVSVRILTHNNAEYSANDPIPVGSLVYNQVSSLKQGQPVMFSGKIISTSDGWERSLSEKGSLRNPEFKVEFTSIQPLGN